MKGQNENKLFLRKIRVTLLATFAVIVQLFDITASAQSTSVEVPSAELSTASLANKPELLAVAKENTELLKYLAESTLPRETLINHLRIAAEVMIPKALDESSDIELRTQLLSYLRDYRLLLKSTCGKVTEPSLYPAHSKICFTQEEAQ